MRSEQKTSLKDLHLSLQSPTHRVSEPSIYIHSSCQVQPAPLLFIAICVANGHGVFFGVRKRCFSKPNEGDPHFCSMKKWNNYRFLSIQLITSFTNRAPTDPCSLLAVLHTFSFSTVHGCSMSGDPSTCRHVGFHLCGCSQRGCFSRKRRIGSPRARVRQSLVSQGNTKNPPIFHPASSKSWAKLLKRVWTSEKIHNERGFFEGWKVGGISKEPTKIQVRCDTWQWMILMQTR